MITKLMPVGVWECGSYDGRAMRLAVVRKEMAMEERDGGDKLGRATLKYGH